MVILDDNELIFAFPDVNVDAEWRVHFRRVDAPEELVRIIKQPVDGGILLAAQGRLAA